MNKELNSKKLNYQLQQMAFQKYPFEINNKTFFCLETYFQEELLNGVDLQLKEAKGITSQPQKISYIAQNQQLILAIGSNIVSYNAQKRSYTLLAEVAGFVQILRTYTCKINNRIFIFWLQTDEQGLNMKVQKTEQSKIPPKKSQQSTQVVNKIPSIWNLFDPSGLKLKKSPSTDTHTIKRKSSDQTSPKKVKFDDNQPVQEKSKSKKKVRIDAPEEEEQNDNKRKKKMRICIFDYEKKSLFHKQPIEIQQTETISDIVLYYTSEKILGYVINDELQERGKVYYKRIKIDDSYCGQQSTSKRFLNKKKTLGNQKKAQKFQCIDSIFQVPLLKYNGQTDQYLFKDHNTIYSLQIYQVQHEIFIGKGSIKNFSKHELKEISSKAPLIPSKNSIQIESEEELDQQNLSMEIQKVTNKMITSFNRQSSYQRQKYRLKIIEEVQLLTDETIIDISINEVYLVVLTSEYIRFYSIFNLNTLLFKCEINEIKGNPPPSSIELNKSYLLLTHQNSTFVSSYTILQRKLKYNSTCQVEIEHCQSIVKLFMNSYNCEVAILAKQYQIEGRMTNIIKSRKIIQNTFSGYKKSYIDVCLAYINFSSTKCETKPLFLKNQRFRNILTCKWHSEYLIETQNQIISKDWRESFQNLKCSCLHPTGQYLIIGFNDCFKIYAVTQQGLQNTYMSDGVKDCQAIAYSQYGQHFAVGSSNSIVIYNSYNCFKKLSISLPMGSLVESLQYSNNHLICVLRTKRIIIYHTLLDYKQIFTFNPKNYLNQNKNQFQKKTGGSVQNLLALTIKGLVSIDVNALYYDVELNVIIFSSGKKILFINTLTNQSLGSYDIQGISCMEYNKHLATLFLGTFRGELIAFPWPNKPSNILSKLPRFKFHSQKILKIKLTADYKYLISLGSDMSIYKCNISYILNLKRLKGNEIAQYKGNKNAVAYCNFLYNKGICQFSHTQNTQKLQNKKQLQEQVVNTVFMLPQQRHKQKQTLFEQISATKQQLTAQNIKEYEPLQEESIFLRNQIIKIKQQIIKTQKRNQAQLQKQRQRCSQQTSKHLNLYSELSYELRMIKLKLNENINTKSTQYEKQFHRFLQENEGKQRQYKKKLKDMENQNQKHAVDFLEIDLIQKQKQSFLSKHLEAYLKEIEFITTKNGQLSCKNSSIQKQILVLKYRIEELKFVTLNANFSIQKLKGKQSKQIQEKTVFQKLLVENAKIDVSQMQKKYIKATKQLIQKNKQIDINLNQYAKQKQILVQLQKTVQKTEEQIDRIVDSLQEEKQFKKHLKQKYEASNLRFKELLSIRNSKKTFKSKIQLQLKKYLQEVEKVQNDFQAYNNSNANRQEVSTETVELMAKMNNLKDFGKKRAELQKERSARQSVRKKGQSKQKKNKRQFTQEDESSNQKVSQTALGQLMGTFKKSNSNLSKQIKSKKARCSTQDNQNIGMSSTQKSSTKLNFKINHNKFRQNFNFYRKDDLLNQTASFNFNRQKQRHENQKNTLRKTGTKYFQVKTQASYNTQRLVSKNKQNQNLGPGKIQQKPTLQTFRNSCSYERQKLLSRQKQDVHKKLSTQDKCLSKIKTDKKLFMTTKKKLHSQNQDLIGTYNSLTYDNKYFKNILRAYEQNLDEEDKNCIFNSPTNGRHLSKNSLSYATKTSKDKVGNTFRNSGNTKIAKFHKDQKIVTPFDKYLKCKQDKITELKNTQTQQRGFSSLTNREGFKTTLNRIKTKTSQQNRVKTVPCVQLSI